MADDDLNSVIVALVLAAGLSRRMQTENKLLARWRNRPLVRHVTERALESRAEEVWVVTGHESEKIADLLADLPVRLIHNPDYISGMAGSLKAGVAMLPPRVDGLLVCLGDMPQVTADQINALIADFSPARGKDICIPTYKGRQGNPVLLGRRLFYGLTGIDGDIGARELVRANADRVVEVPVDTTAILSDIDTPEQLSQLRNNAN